MFTKKLPHSFFKELHKRRSGYSGVINFLQYKDVEVTIRERSSEKLDYFVEELIFIRENLNIFLDPITDDAFSAYENIKDVVEGGYLDLDRYGVEMPEINSPNEVWSHMVLEDIIIEPKSKYQIRLGFGCAWDIEHDFGIYITDRQYQYSGVSV